ncbi:MAG TPA: methyl-accepting chemotaxis protein [Leptospiraceae bacterium]|nr:methyl-accepting chemotaxis protein [Leptospiraceae bacterium]HNI94942.1 methyl-accepting chemotaxis protein [Leptospiraceae bacterium]HNM02585.1 methyl-accepting chemotaxis protein [Leptospiraceae bacterium]HNN02132.1 methyl-accepting chemotaxis protein [Leptospiraceae bacterium]
MEQAAVLFLWNSTALRTAMNGSFSKKILVSVTGFILLSVMGFISSLIFINFQKKDALLVNLAGRQRMLSQKMIKELFLLQIEKNPSRRKSDLDNSVKIFDSTLKSLLNGGEAPLDLEWKRSALLPSSSDIELVEQLKKITAIWKEIRPFLDEPEKSLNPERLAELIEKNNTLLKEMDKAVVIFQNQAENKVSLMFTFQIVFLALGIVLSAFYYFYAGRKIILPLKHISDYMKVIASNKGDLTYKVKIETDDELGMLSINFNQFSEILRLKLLDLFAGFRDIIVNISSVGRRMEESGEKFYRIEKELESGHSELDSILHSITEQNASIAEMNTAAQSLASSSERMKAAVQNIFQMTESGKKDILLVSGRMKDAEKSIFELAEKNFELAGKLHSIDSVMQTVNEIAERTNLLALNASIESARAGERGKGFAVVASEIGKLADASQRAVDEIGKSLKEIIKKISSNSLETEGISSNISEILKKNDSAFKNISDTFSEIDGFTDIASGLSLKSEALQKLILNVAENSDRILNNTKSINGKFNRITGSSAGIRLGFQGLIHDSSETVESSLNTVKMLSSINLCDSAKFQEEIEAAVSAHLKWIEKLDSILKGAERNLELSHRRCKFGIFYFSSPVPPGCEEQWQMIDRIHEKIHSSAEKVYDFLDSEMPEKALDQVQVTKGHSRELIGLLRECVSLNSDYFIKRDYNI